jgi:N utilization substance protein B
VADAGPRRRAREAALQVLFAADVSARLDPAQIDEAYDAVAAEFELPARARERARALCRGVAANLKRIDEEIERVRARWKLSRMGIVDRNVLRVATYELVFEPATPRAVVIDEAVEVARRFAGEASPAFVNGVLDEIARRSRGAEA